MSNINNDNWLKRNKNYEVLLKLKHVLLYHMMVNSRIKSSLDKWFLA